MAAKPVVAGTDGSKESMRAVEWAAREAALRGAPLRIVSAAGLLPRMIGSHGMSDYDTVADHLRRDRDRALASAAERAAKTAPGLLIDTDRLIGEPAQAVTESGTGGLMLVLGSRGVSAFAAMVLGSVSRYAAIHASCPVVVVRDQTTATHKRIGVGVGDRESPAVLEFAFEEAALRHASVMAVHAWHTPESDISRAGQAPAAAAAHVLAAAAARDLEDMLDRWREKYPGVPVSQDVVHGHPGRVLVGLSARADLVVIGRRSTHATTHGPGTVTHAVLNHAHGPVVTVPSSHISD
jgi:nucleotide-binding universal stress UspA family protein